MSEAGLSKPKFEESSEDGRLESYFLLLLRLINHTREIFIGCVICFEKY